MPSEQIPNPCRALLTLYIDRLEQKELSWYETASARQYVLWHIFTLISLGATLATSIVAALMQKEFFGEYGRLLLVVLPLIGTVATAVLSQFRFHELEDLRERGMIEMEDIVLYARGQLAAAPDELACQTAFEETRRRVKNLSLSQHRADTELRAGAARKLSRKTPKGDQDVA